jgi:hypothetical protein
MKTESKTFRRDVIRIRVFIISLPFGKKQFEHDHLKLKSIQVRTTVYAPRRDVSGAIEML